jgi:hypothetical protein
MKTATYVAITTVLCLASIFLLIVCGFVPSIRLLLWIPTALSLLGAGWFLLGLPSMLIYKGWKNLTNTMRIDILVAVGFIAVLGEYSLREQGYRSGFVCEKNQYAKIPFVSVDSIINFPVEETDMMIYDSFGITKFNPHGKEKIPWTVNEEGFASRYAFTQETIDSLKHLGYVTIAAFGDSYTFGSDADQGKSFIDLLGTTNKKYAVFNFGIPGVDPVQYQALTEKYIQSGKLCFDQVLVVLCGANDLHPIPGENLIAGIPPVYKTNVGMYLSRPGRKNETLLSARAAYLNFLDEGTVFMMPGGRIISKSIVASYSANIVRRIAEAAVGIPTTVFQRESFDKLCGLATVVVESGLDTTSTLSPYITSIRQKCSAVHTPVIFILVPGKEMVKKGKCPSIPGVIALDPKRLSVADYNGEGPNAHPNTRAHYEIFLMVDSILAIQNTSYVAHSR